MDHALWDHLPVLVRAKSKESVEHILQSLWRTRKTGLDAPEKAYIQDLLQLPAENDLDPLLVCLRILIRRCVYENFNKDEIQKLFPPEVPPELQRLLVLLLMKFQREWREDAVKDQVSLPRLKAMTWSMENQSTTPANRMAVINLRLQETTQSSSGETDVKFQITKDTLEAMLRSMYYIRDQLSNVLRETTQSSSGETDVKFQITKDTLEAMLRSMYYIRDQLSNVGATSSGQALRKGQQ